MILFLLCGWKLIPMNFAYNDDIAGRTWNELYARYNGKICSKFGMYPIRENKQDYIEWYCIETVGSWDGTVGTEPNITTPQYNETRIQELETRIQFLEDQIAYLWHKAQENTGQVYRRGLNNIAILRPAEE
jgi:hypothetical protein